MELKPLYMKGIYILMRIIPLKLRIRYFFIKRFNSISNTLPSSKVSDILEQEEIRITKFFTNTLSAKHPDRYILIDKNCIVEVLIHQKAEKDVKEEVRKHCMSIGCTNVSVY